MKITIEPDEGPAVVFNEIVSHALVVDYLEEGVSQRCHVHTGGDPFVLIGRLTEAIERLRASTIGG